MTFVFVVFQGPEGSVDKPFLWTEGRVSLRAALNKSAYGHGEHISVTIDVRNDSRKIIRKIRVSKENFYFLIILNYLYLPPTYTPYMLEIIYTYLFSSNEGNFIEE